jgi:tetratricopeptide (TPR) repeat protein/transcriptional regulator with XRE-family HTH domain
LGDASCPYRAGGREQGFGRRRAVTEQSGPGFAGLLRQLRTEARLTQEELAEAAGLSPRSVSDLERGIHRTARKDTAGLLAGALRLAEPARALFVAAARGRGPVAEVLAARQEVAPGSAAAAASRTLPRDTASFTGRERELARLLEQLTPEAADGRVVGIHAIDGMAGIGKTTFAVHAAHRLAPSFPDGQLFLPLHAHTAGQRPVDPADALASLLLTAGLAAAQIPPGLEARAARWRDVVASKKILLLLDDAAGHQQVRPLLPGTAESLVLVTSRRRLAALEDATQVSLDTLSPAEAGALLVRLAARPGLHAADAAVGELNQLCGYLPLAIAMLASRLRNHPVRTSAGLAAELAQARDRLALMQVENVSVGAAFGLSYADLTADPRRLFRRLGLVPGPGIDAYAAAALDGTDLATARRHLDELYDQHLIAEPAPGRYQMHDLLREHARALAATDDPAETAEAAGRLLDYYLHTALAASPHFTTRARVYRRPLPGSGPEQAPDVSTLGQAAAWLEAERANLHAAAEYAVGHAYFPHATAMPVVMSGFLAARGHWDQSAALHQGALSAARRADDPLGEADVLLQLGALQRETGDYPAAAASLAQARAIYGDVGDRVGHAHALIDLGFLDVLTGDYPAAAASQQQALTLARSASDRLTEAAALNHLGLVQHLAGDYPAAAASQQQALELSRELGNLYGQAYALNDLGVVQQETGDYPAAAASQLRALELFRELGYLLGQAHVLNDLGVVQQETGDLPAAAASHQQALTSFRDLGSRLGQAEALNRLGELATRTSAAGQARERHTQALAIARDLGAAPEEARALEGLGRSYLQDGDPGQAAAHLRQALTIYQRIGALAARRIEKTLRDHTLTSAVPAPAGSETDEA